MEYQFNDGGRAVSGIKGGINDCVTRALSIVSIKSYAEVTQAVAPFMTTQGVDVYGAAFGSFMRANGFVFIPSTFPTLVKDLPAEGLYLVFTPNHLTALVNGTVNDTFDTREEEIRGYWVRAKLFNVERDGKVLNRYPLNHSQAQTMTNLYNLNYSRAIGLATIKPVTL